MSNRRPSRRFFVVYGTVLLVFVSSGMGLVCRQHQMAQADAFYQAVAPSVPSLRTPELESKSESELELESESESESEPCFPEKEKPPEKSRQLLSLSEKYPDMVGWLTMDGTPVDYPVVQCGDNRYYLNHLPDGSYNTAGSIFMDYRCTGDSGNLILYGHNMRNGSMFGSLKLYEDAVYLEEHREFSLFTAEEELRCRITLVSRVRADDERVYAPEQPENTGRIVTLSTCTGLVPTERLIVQAVILQSDTQNEIPKS